MTRDREQYTMGYGPAATAIMARRTAQNHAGFFLSYLKPGLSLLDCGCGPGTITLGFAQHLAPGQVVGTEIEDSHVSLARENAAKHGVANVSFEVADIYELPLADASFDAVFMSAVLANLREPIRGLLEARRVLKPGGLIGVKDFDHGGDIFYPAEPAIEKYGELYLRMRRENGHEPEVGRTLGVSLRAAGFSDVKLAAVYETFADPNAVAGFAFVSTGLLAEGWGELFMSRGWATAEDVAEMRAAWQRFGAFPGAIFAAAWFEAVARKE